MEHNKRNKIRKVIYNMNKEMKNRNLFYLNLIRSEQVFKIKITTNNRNDQI